MAIALGNKAEASFIINISQVGSSVVITGSGTIDTTGLSDLGATGTGGLVLPNDFDGGDVVVGSASSSAEVYGVNNLSGPALGSGFSETYASSGSGDAAGFVYGNSAIWVPVGYTSGAQLSGTSTYDDTTIADLGLTPGSYTFTWGTGADADSATATVQAPAPEPGTFCLFGVGTVALVLGCLRRRVVRT